MLILYKVFFIVKKYNKNQLTKNKLYLNNRKMKNPPPSPILVVENIPDHCRK